MTQTESPPQLRWVIKVKDGETRVTWADTMAEALANVKEAGINYVEIKPDVTFDLGWQNGWRSGSPNWLIIKECQRRQHLVFREHDQERHVSRTTCPTCSYTYQTDTSG